MSNVAVPYACRISLTPTAGRSIIGLLALLALLIGVAVWMLDATGVGVAWNFLRLI
jgi:hypothetical protein